LYNVVRDMKKAFTPALYEKLINNSFDYAPPYLLLYGFMQQTKKWPMLSLSVMEWEDPKTKGGFKDYVMKYYPDKDLSDILVGIDKYLEQLKKKG
jgi:hypothetical protein